MDRVRGVVGTMNAARSRPDWLATVQSGRKQVQSRVCTPGFSLSVLKWSCEEKLGSVRPSRKFCMSVTVYQFAGVFQQKLISFSVLSCINYHEPTHYGMIVCYMVPNQTESASKFCSTTYTY